MIKTIALIDHSFHKKSRSTQFLHDIIRESGLRVEVFWDESWDGGAPVEWRTVEKYDAIVGFQALPRFIGSLGNRHGNVTFIPMLDSYGITDESKDLRPFFSRLSGVKIMNFSRSLHYICNAMGLLSRFFQYYQKPQPSPPQPSKGLKGFFWCRRPEDIDWQIIRTLVESSEFESFHLHYVADRISASGMSLPSSRDINRFHMTISDSWFENKNDFMKLVEESNVYFTPRLEEGIGQGLLEAISKGKCVVAPDRGTMNEYLRHGYNGILYDPKNPQPVDFSKAASYGVNGWKTAVEGYREWMSSRKALLDLIVTPFSDLDRLPYKTISKRPGSLRDYLVQSSYFKRYKR